MALDRISYAFPIPGSSPVELDTSQWQGANFADLHSLLLEVVGDGPSKGLMDLIQDITADPIPTTPPPPLRY